MSYNGFTGTRQMDEPRNSSCVDDMNTRICVVWMIWILCGLDDMNNDNLRDEMNTKERLSYIYFSQ